MFILYRHACGDGVAANKSICCTTNRIRVATRETRPVDASQCSVTAALQTAVEECIGCPKRWNEKTA